jgi:hypothetical protein
MPVAVFAVATIVVFVGATAASAVFTTTQRTGHTVAADKNVKMF